MITVRGAGGRTTGPQFPTEASRGAEGVSTLLPHDPRAADGVGADAPGGTGSVAGPHAHEQRLRRPSGVDVLLLRAGSFPEDLLDVLPVVAELGRAPSGGTIRTREWRTAATPTRLPVLLAAR